MSRETVRVQAHKLAQENKRTEPAIQQVFWFPSDTEIRLVELEEETPPALSGRVEPFYFRPAPLDGLTFPAGIAIIQSREFGVLRLPRGWGSWKDAEELVV
jgi:hypothetical protein